MTFARPSGHPGLVEDALLPGFDQLHQVQVRLGEIRSLQNREQIIRSQGRTHSQPFKELFSDISPDASSHLQ